MNQEEESISAVDLNGGHVGRTVRIEKTENSFSDVRGSIASVKHRDDGLTAITIGQPVADAPIGEIAPTMEALVPDDDDVYLEFE